MYHNTYVRLRTTSSDPPSSSSHEEGEPNEEKQEGKNSEEWPHVIDAPERHHDVHTKQTSNKIEWNQEPCYESDLAQNSVRLVALGDVVDGKLSEVIAVRARKHLLVLAKVPHHSDNVILNIA